MVGRVEPSRPEMDGSGWFVYAVDLGANSPLVSAWAICADAA